MSGPRREVQPARHAWHVARPDPDNPIPALPTIPDPTCRPLRSIPNQHPILIDPIP